MSKFILKLKTFLSISMFVCFDAISYGRLGAGERTWNDDNDYYYSGSGGSGDAGATIIFLIIIIAGWFLYAYYTDEKNKSKPRNTETYENPIVEKKVNEDENKHEEIKGWIQILGCWVFIITAILFLYS